MRELWDIIVECFIPRHEDWRLFYASRKHPLGGGYLMRRWAGSTWEYRLLTEDEELDALDERIT